MNILLINDTSRSTNFGCIATSRGLHVLFEEHRVISVFAEEVHRLNWLAGGTWLSRLLVFPGTLFDRVISSVYDGVVGHDKALQKKIAGADMVVVNGEGSIHHRRPSSWTLMAIIRAAREYGKPVQVVNVTFDGLGPEDIRTLRMVNRIVVRETASSDYLNTLGLEHAVGADAAWIFLEKEAAEMKGIASGRAKNERTLLTIGATGGAPPEDLPLPEKSETWYLRVDSADEAHLTALEGRVAFGGVIQVSGGPEAPKRILSSMADFDRLISGRHHANIFAYHLGLDVVLLPCPTHKLQGTHDQFRAAGERVYELAKKNKISL